MSFTPEFIDAFNHTMLYEVGGSFDANDPEVIAGLIDTPQQRKKVGYVNDPTDMGGETKFGVAVNANPDIDIKQMTLQDAMMIYYQKYWLVGSCDKMQYPLSVLHFDGCTNHGVGRAIKFLQQALGIDPQTTNVGPRTTELMASANVVEVCNKICDIRSDFYKAIVERKPAQVKFLKGWLRRINEMRDYVNKAGA